MPEVKWVNCSSGAFLKIEVAHRFGTPVRTSTIAIRLSGVHAPVRTFGSMVLPTSSKVWTEPSSVEIVVATIAPCLSGPAKVIQRPSQ